MKLVPFFVLNGTRYEIKVTRYLQAEYDKLIKESGLNEEDAQKAVMCVDKLTQAQEIAEKFKIAKDEYFDDIIDERKEKIYKKYKALYEETMKNVLDAEENVAINNLRQKNMDVLEQVAIIGLRENYPQLDTKKLWEEYVEKVGKNKAIEWLEAMSQCVLSDEEEEENSFLSQMRTKNAKMLEQRKNGIAKIRK